jgi:hypothetical protein
MISQLFGIGTAVILAATSSASSWAADSGGGKPKRADQSGQVNVVVEKSLCTIVLHRNGDKDWICEPMNPRHPNRYPTPKLRHGDKVVGHGDAG